MSEPRKAVDRALVDRYFDGNGLPVPLSAVGVVLSRTGLVSVRTPLQKKSRYRLKQDPFRAMQIALQIGCKPKDASRMTLNRNSLAKKHPWLHANPADFQFTRVTRNFK